MFINLQGTHLAVFTQKKPELWLSAIPPYLQVVNLQRIQFELANQSVNDVVKEIKANTSFNTEFQIDFIKLTDPTKETHIKEDVISAKIDLDKQKLVDLTLTMQAYDDVFSSSFDLQEQRLYAWGVRGEVLYDDHSQFKFNLDKQKLYEEIQ